MSTADREALWRALQRFDGRSKESTFAIDYAASVIAIQKQLERVRLLRLRTTKWTVLLAPLCWTPLCIVAADALFGVDLYAVAPLWLALNAAAGVLAIPALLWLARRRMLQPLTRHLDGRALAVFEAALGSVDCGIMSRRAWDVRPSVVHRRGVGDGSLLGR